MKIKTKIFCALVTIVLGGAAQAGLIFQADFNGTGTGTGGVGDVVTYGGTSSIYQYTTATTSISSASSLGGGSYLNLGVTGTPSNGLLGGVNITPTAAANSWAAMNTVSAGTTTLHGAGDFFFRVNSLVDSSVGNWFRPFDVGTSSSGGLRLIMQNMNATTIRMNLVGGTGAFLTGGSYTTAASNIYLDVSYASLATLGTTSHYAFTMNTDSGTGVTTLAVYARPDTGIIDTTSNTNLLGSTTFKIDGSVITAGFTTGAYNFEIGGIVSGGTNLRDISADLLRLYDSVPTTFSAIPETSTTALMLIGGVALLVVTQSVRKKCAA